VYHYIAIYIFKKACVSFRGAVPSNIVLEFGILNEPLDYSCMHEESNRVCIAKCWSDAFPVHSELNQGSALSPFLFSFILQYAIL